MPLIPTKLATSFLSCCGTGRHLSNPIMPRMNRIVAVMILSSAANLTAESRTPAKLSISERLAETVMQQRPAGLVSAIGASGKWTNEQGVLLDGLGAQWLATANGAEFAYVKATVDKYITPGGAINGYTADNPTLSDIEMGRSVLLVYRVTLDPRYAKAAKFLEDQLALQHRASSVGRWHKQIYLNQMWLNGAYRAQPFRAAYAATFQQSADFDDIAKQLLLMSTQRCDPKTGLLKCRWNESKFIPWAEKSTGISPEDWARTMGWYCMALIDVLDWLPEDHPQHAALVDALNRNLATILKVQDPQTGLWWKVMQHAPQDWPVVQKQPEGSVHIATAHNEDSDFTEAYASCMFTYSLAKGVRLGYLPQAWQFHAQRAWEGIRKQFVTMGPSGAVTLHGNAKAGGAGGTNGSAGFNPSTNQKGADQDATAAGALLLAGSEVEHVSSNLLGQPQSGLMRSSKDFGGHPEPNALVRKPTVLIDAWFNSQIRKNAFGQTELFHYKWNDESNSGYSFFGRAFRRYGATLATLPAAPTAAALSHVRVYIIASPDIPSKNTNPHYMDKASAEAIEAWVQSGGVLLLFSNDRDNTEFDHFNTLSDRFGIHFNPVLSHHVIEPDHKSGEVVIPPHTGIFGDGFIAYMKDTSTITPTGAAKAVVTDHGDVMIAVAHIGKGFVLAVVDPWFYNEYADGRKMGEYLGFEAAQDVAAWALSEAR